MADNTTLNPALSVGDQIRTIQRSSGGQKTEVVQLDFGGQQAVAASQESLVSGQNPLPVADPSGYLQSALLAQTLYQQYAQGCNANGFIPVETPGFLTGVQ